MCAILLVACGDATPGGDGAAPADAGARDGGGPGDLAIPDGAVAPPPATCTAPEGAADVSQPTTVVSDCTEGGLAAALAKGGVITFACGAQPAVITVTKTLDVRTDVDTVLDGGGRVTLDGGGKVRVLSFNHADYRVNDTRLTLQHLTVANGRIAGTMAYAPATPPCSQGFYDGYGAGLFFRDGVLLVVDVVFVNNAAEALGPDVGGGAIALHGVKKATVVDSVFLHNSGANGGAVAALNAELDVYNSRFEGNRALGNGANGDDAKKCAVVADNGQHQIGSGGNGGAISIDGGDDLTHTFCGVAFVGNQGGMSALGGALFRTPDGPMRTTTIDRCLFDGNSALGSAGAAYFHNSMLVVRATTFHGNGAPSLAGIQADGTTLDFINTTFADNQATAMGSVGGAIALFGGDGTLRNCTFAGNHADGFGAAVFGGAPLVFQNTLFVGNTGQNAGAPMQCQVTASAGAGDFQFPPNHVNGGAPDAPCATGIAFVDPQLGAYGDHGGPTPTLVPASGSPAIGAGKACPPTDQRGHARPPDGCTSGATEAP